MTGTISRIVGVKRTFCFIKTEDGKEYFSHQKRFAEPEKMMVGLNVEFQPMPPLRPGKKPLAIDVIAA